MFMARGARGVRGCSIPAHPTAIAIQHVAPIVLDVVPGMVGIMREDAAIGPVCRAAKVFTIFRTLVAPAQSPIVARLGLRLNCLLAAHTRYRQQSHSTFTHPLPLC